MSTRALKFLVLAALVLGTLAVGNSRYQQVQAEQPPRPTSLPSASSPTPPPGGTVQIVGPTEGTPGQTLTFKLMDGTTQLSVDRWEQVLNPDLYLGNDYVTSFCLSMQPQQDGSLQITAPAPGRYKLAAIKGDVRWETYVLIRPEQVGPEIRGFTFVSDRSLDKDHAPNVLDLAKRAGRTWASIGVLGGIDLDSTTLEIQVPCSFCSQTESLDDIGWLIDEAHRQGLKVAVTPDIWARTSNKMNFCPGFFVMETKDGLIGDLPALLPDSLITAVMQSYARYMLQMAEVAQQHGAEAMFVGNESQCENTPGNLLWSQKQQWKDMVAQVRITFHGKLWIGQVLGGCEDPSDLDIWELGDGINAPAEGGLKGSGSQCGRQATESNNPTAEQMTANMSQAVGSMLAFKLQAVTGLPLIWREFYPVPIDGLNYRAGEAIGLVDSSVRDNQELVDYFEAQMRTVGHKQVNGFFFFAVDLADSTGGNSFDALKQPALVNAIANWWGGDTNYFEPCMGGETPHGLLYEEDFEPSACPLQKQDSFIPNTGWEVIEDSSKPQNHVLRGTQQAVSPSIPAIGRSSWMNYTVKLRVRLVGGPTAPSGAISVRVGTEGDNYGVHLGFNHLILIKHLNTQGKHLTLANYVVPEGTQLGRWYELEIRAVGPMLTVNLDGKQVIQVTDQDSPLFSGGVALFVGSGLGPATVDFDDFLITKSN